MTSVEAYAIVCEDGSFYTKLKSGIPQVFTLEHQALYRIKSDIDALIWSNDFYVRFPQYIQHGGPHEIPKLSVKKVRIEVID
jgi:hypothetical protein